MATQNYNVNVNTTQAVAAMTRLQQSTSKVNAAFVGLKSAVGALALGSAIASALRYADAINDIAEATGIGTANILGFSRAVAANGGSAESAQASILKLSQSIDEAATGSAKTQYQFAQIGISLQDLATLSEQDILARTVEGLSKIEDNSKRISLATDLLGKSARSINFAGVNSSLATSIQQSQQYAASQKAAAALQDNLNRSVDQFRISLIKALEPLIKLLNGLKPETIDAFVSALVQIGAVLGGLYAARTAILALGAAFTVVLAILSPVTAGMKILAAVVGLVAGIVTGLELQFRKAFGVGFIDAAVESLKIWAREAGLIGAKVTEGLNTGSGPRGSIGTGRDAEEQRNKKIREINDGLARQRTELAGISIEFGKQNRLIAENIVKEAGYLNLSEDQVEVLKAQDDVYKRMADAVKDLQDKKAGLKDEEKALIPVINQQIKAIEARAKIDSEMVGASVQALQGQRLLEQDRVANIERITQALQRQQDTADALNQIRKDGNQAIADAQAEGAQAGMTPLQRQMDQISRANQKAAQQAAESFARQFEGMDMTAAQAQELARGLDLITEKYEKLTEVQMYNLDESRTFVSGWTQAFNEYADAATNAALQASTIFATTTKGMEDMIVNFAKTGKLEFKSFLGSIVEQILRSQIQQLIAKSFGGLNLGGGGGGGNLFSALFGLPGFASGGMIPNNGPVVVGERGPEILTGAGGRSVIPNDALGGSTNITYNINAVDASSFRNLVASDPEFIFAVTEQGRRRQPGQRR